MKKTNVKIAVLLILVMSLLLGLVSCNNDDESTASSGEASEVVSESSNENASETSNEGENSDDASEDTSEDASEDTSDDTSEDTSEDTSDDTSEDTSDDTSKEPILAIPDEYKDLATMKAFAKIDYINGAIMEMKMGDEMYSIEIIMAIKGNDAYVLMDMLGMRQEIVALNGVYYQLDNENKKYTIVDGMDSFMSYDDSFFDNLTYVKTYETELSGVKYTVDVFNQYDEDLEETSPIEFYVLDDEIKYLGQDGMTIPFTFKSQNVDKYLVIPDGYTEKTAKDSLQEVFGVSEEIKDTKTGKAFSALDFDKGFAIYSSMSSYGVDMKDDITVKGEKVYIYTYSKYDNEEMEEAELFIDGYWYYFDSDSHTYYKMPGSVEDGLYSWYSLADLSFVKTFKETKDGVEYTVEKFIDSFDDVINFYFDGDKLVACEQDGSWCTVTISTKIDESVLEIPEGYTEVPFDTEIEDM